MVDFFAWCSACPLLMIIVALAFSDPGRGIGYAYLALATLAGGYVVLLVAALITGITRNTLGASLSGVLVSLPVAVVGYRIVLYVYTLLSDWAA
ncbi:hypothetical protein DX03_05095 [Stenotrophomonas rhizophila]|nr:hypothetical protein DX03_05095 [Stenotrophomonas rhizophila]